MVNNPAKTDHIIDLRDERGCGVLILIGSY